MDMLPSHSDVEAYLAPYGRFFSRREARGLAAGYVLGLLLEGGRKSVEPMARLVETSGRSLQRLLTQVRWDHEGVLRAFRRRMVERYAGDGGILVIGRTVFPKRGSHSPGVARQYIEELGRAISGQTAVDSVYVRGGTVFPWAMDLYIPTFWSRPRSPEYRLRRLKAGIPGHVRHRERWELALDQVDLAVNVGLAVSAVTAGMSFGRFAAFRDGLIGRGLRAIVEAPPDTEVFTREPSLRQVRPERRGRGRPRKRLPLMEADAPPVLISSLAAGTFQGNRGTPGVHSGADPRPAMTNSSPSGQRFLIYPGEVWPAEGYRDGALHGPLRLALERPFRTGPEGGPRYYLADPFSDPGTRELASITRASAQALGCKNSLVRDLGLLHHEGRSWKGWHRHVTLVFLAWGFLLETTCRPGNMLA